MGLRAEGWQIVVRGGVKKSEIANERAVPRNPDVPMQLA
jgi:hypothetical protein